jgi:hypothetical protein
LLGEIAAADCAPRPVRDGAARSSMTVQVAVAIAAECSIVASRRGSRVSAKRWQFSL